MNRIRRALFAYDIIEDTPDYILIVDRSQEHGCMSITNAAEQVIEDLSKRNLLYEDKTVYYRDTEGEVDELCHEHGFFTGFAPGPER